MSTGSYRYFMRGRAAEVRNVGDLLQVFPDLMLRSLGRRKHMEHVRQLTDLVQQRERTKRDVTTRCAQTAF